MNTLVALASIVAVWVLLLGTVLMCRHWRLSRSRSIAAVGCCYAAISAVALLWLGWTWNGVFGVIGMSLPCTVAMTLVVVKPVES